MKPTFAEFRAAKTLGEHALLLDRGRPKRGKRQRVQAAVRLLAETNRILRRMTAKEKAEGRKP